MGAEVSTKTYVMVNPASANGKTGRRWPEFASRLRGCLPQFEVGFTEYSRHGVDLVRAAVKEGARHIVSVGGDGTHNEAVNGLFEGESLIADDVVLSVVPTGTGGDLRRTLGLPADPLKAMECIGQRPREVDVGRAQYLDHDGNAALAHFINISSFGASGTVVDIVNNSSKRLGGRLSFLLGVVRGTLQYRNQEMRIILDEGTSEERVFQGRFYNGVVANARYFGGGMLIAPDASMSDGLLDCVFLGDLSKFRVLKGTSAIYSGAHLELDDVDAYRAKTVRAEPVGGAEVLIDLDGEQPGLLPATYSLIPAAVQICTGAEWEMS